jgi:hypothetical protein
MYTRPTGAVAAVLDAATLLTAARAVADADPTLADLPLSDGPTPQMLIAVDRGVPAIVNHEGVGGVLGEDGAVPVYFRSGTRWEPIAIPLGAINEAITEKRVDLAEGVRTFGARLDSNHRRWFDRYDSEHRP